GATDESPSRGARIGARTARSCRHGVGITSGQVGARWGCPVTAFTGSVRRVTEHSTTPAAAADVSPRPAPIDRSVLTVLGQAPVGRIPVLDVEPVVDGGRRPTKSVVGEVFTITATVFREGHDAVNATVVLVDPDGGEHPVTMTCVNEGLSHWR